MRYHVIAIEREYGSGGQEIGERVAGALGIPCYGREIFSMAAREKNVSEETLEQVEEKATGSLLYSMYMIANMTNMTPAGLSSENELFLAESEIIRRLTQMPSVIVGRCAVDSLKEREDVLRVFIKGDVQTRRKRAVEVYGIAPQAAESFQKKADRRRAGYYKANTGCEWKSADNYHLILDSSLLGIDRCVEILKTCCQ